MVSLLEQKRGEWWVKMTEIQCIHIQKLSSQMEYSYLQQDTSRRQNINWDKADNKRKNTMGDHKSWEKNNFRRFKGSKIG